MTIKVDRNLSKLYGPQRMLGALSIMTRTGPAIQKPLFYQLLKWIGVLDTLPHLWDDSERLEDMPWGAQSIAAPPPVQA